MLCHKHVNEMLCFLWITLTANSQKFVPFITQVFLHFSCRAEVAAARAAATAEIGAATAAAADWADAHLQAGFTEAASAVYEGPGGGGGRAVRQKRRTDVALESASPRG